MTFRYKYINFILPAFVVVLAIFLLKEYFIPGIQIALGMMVAPFVFKVDKGAFSYRYAFLCIAFLIAYYFLQIYVLLFFSIGCLVFFTIESQSGKIGLLPFLFLICISPAMHYLVNVFTFSIRLELSKYSSIILNAIGIKVQNKGSFFVMPDGDIFSVDTACIGLNMFCTGLCITLLLIGFKQQQTKRKTGPYSLLLVFIATVLCLVITNLLRIVALVFFKSAPGTIHHDLIGIISLIVYMVIPIYFLVSYLLKKQGIIQNETISKASSPSVKRNVMITLCLSLFLVFTTSMVKDYLKHEIKDQKLLILNLPGFSKQFKEDGVAEFKRDSVLIYVKPASKGYESDHPPAMCWQGSGFELEQIAEEHLFNFTLLKAVLKKDSVVQYTAWWYDNGVNKTINQWDWRFSNGEPYRIINITAKSKQELDSLCRYYIKQNLF